jgi:superfamily II DNA or RNA helicase
MLTDLKGMDVPDISLVIQWRASCSLSTIWQRFGRAARDRALHGTALLFAEKEYFDDVRDEKHKRQESKKRKLTEGMQNNQGTKKRAVCNRMSGFGSEQNGPRGVGLGNGGDSRGAPSAAVTDEQLRQLMGPKVELGIIGQKKRRDLDPAMDCLINAGVRGIGCRRKVFDLHFDNGSAGKVQLQIIYATVLIINVS